MSEGTTGLVYELIIFSQVLLVHARSALAGTSPPKLRVHFHSFLQQLADQEEDSLICLRLIGTKVCKKLSILYHHNFPA